MANPLTSRQRLAQMLMTQEQAAPPVVAHTQGLASMLRSGLAGYMEGADARDKKEYFNALSTALMAGDTQAVQARPSANFVGPMPMETTTAEQNALRDVTALAKGGNEWAAMGAPGIAMQRIARERQLSDRSDQRSWQERQADAQLGRLKELVEFKSKFPTAGKTPSSIAEWNEYQGMTPEEKDAYLLMKRANPYLPLGGTMTQPSPTQPGTALGSFPLTPKPDQMPEFKQKQAAGAAAGKQAVKASGDAFESLGKVSQNIVNIDDAIAAIDSGAQTGVVQSMLPSVRTASIELDNVQKRMGLDVIGSVTFGALSEGELNLALDTALPTNLTPPKLRQWLTKKKDAQQKLAKYLSDAAIYLGKPGNTVASWAELQKAPGGPRGAPVGRPPAAAPNTGGGHAPVLTLDDGIDTGGDEDLLNKYAPVRHVRH